MMSIWGNIPFKKMGIEDIVNFIEKEYLKQCQEEGTFAEEYGNVLFCLNPSKIAVKCKYYKQRKPEEGAGAYCKRWIDYDK